MTFYRGRTQNIVCAKSDIDLLRLSAGRPTEDPLRRGVFTSVVSPERAALNYIDSRNEDAKPFVWTADAGTILRRVEKNRAVRSKSGH